MNLEPLQILQDIFGYKQFREPQAEVIDTLVSGRDALVVMPTGGGKSICYQLPALIRAGCAIVISPLIALMQDQVAALSQWGIKAGCLNSSMSLDWIDSTEQQLIAGELNLLYIAPERLLQQRTLALLQSSKLALFAIDEAHCVSQWGHDFRPEYLQLNRLVEYFPTVPRIALTATADQRTQQEIVQRLGLINPKSFIQGFDRPNIRYRISQKNNAKQQLLNFLKQEHPSDAGIIYCLSRKRVENIAAWLVEQGFLALPYHAGLDGGIRQRNQHRFLTEDGIIMVATIAFGMGIDKPNVRFVAHLDLPRSIEAYYQETGRAGRDGQPADAWMLYGLQDILLVRSQMENSMVAASQKMVERQKLEALLGLCEVTSCRRQVLLGYFGETEHPVCNNCDTCLEPVPVWDGTSACRKGLSAIYRCGQRFGVNHIVDVLLAKETEKTKQFQHNNLSVWGIGTELNKKQWRSVFRQLAAQGFLEVDMENYGSLKLTEKCRPLLRGEQIVKLRQDRKPASLKKEKAPQAQLDAADNSLWQALKSVRKKLADEQEVPPYFIFHDSTLLEMVHYQPQTTKQFRLITGVGALKQEQYAEYFLKLLNDWNKTMPEMDFQAKQSLQLYEQGMNVAAIANKQHLTEDLIYSQLAIAIKLGKLSIEGLLELSDAELEVIEKAIFSLRTERGYSLKPVYEMLSKRYSMGLLRCIEATIT